MYVNAVAVLLSLVALVHCTAFRQNDTLSTTPTPGSFLLASNGSHPHILFDSKDSQSIAGAVTDLAQEFGRVFGTDATWQFLNATGMPIAPTGLTASTLTQPLIIVGSVGNSEIIDSLISSGKIEVSPIEGQWESYISTTVSNPWEGVDAALVIVGSDRRGTIYGMYDVSEQIGVSPLYWWADVPVKRKSAIYAMHTTKVVGAPSVQYRGLFINNAGPATYDYVVNHYANTTYTIGLGNDYYGHVFELILRLKGKLLWPETWYGMFNVDDPRNGLLADYYGVVMGTSHTEPMMRMSQEQSILLNGTWDWLGNEANVKTFMREGVHRSRNWESVYTTGMRGLGDASSPTLNATTEEQILAWQEDTLVDVLEVNRTEIPKIMVLFDELGSYYEQQGMQVPDDITLLYPDDNAGTMMRLPNSTDAERAGGLGIYYHMDMNAPPRCYKWINTIQTAKTWQQMELTYSHQARKLWMVNIGDIKALELPLSHVFDMAYDMDSFESLDSSSEWLTYWATKHFGSAVAEETTQIMTEYGMLIIRLKYEQLSSPPYFFNLYHYDEAESNIEAWRSLAARAQTVYNGLDPDTQPAFFEMILHACLGGSTVEDLYYNYWLNGLYAQQGRASTAKLALNVYELFGQDADLTYRFNNMLGGRWKGYADQVHIGYTTWADPLENIMPVPTFNASSGASGADVGVAIQGGLSTINSSSLTTISLDCSMPSTESRWIEVYAMANGTFGYTVASNASYLSLSQTTGQLVAPGALDSSDHRITLAVDWASAPPGSTTVALTVASANNQSIATIYVPVQNDQTPSNLTAGTFVASNGALSIEAEHYAPMANATVPITNATMTNATTPFYVVLPDYGRTLSGVTLYPYNCAPQDPSTAPYLTYPFYTAQAATNVNITVYIGPGMNIDAKNPMRWAVAVDQMAPIVVQPVYDYVIGPPVSTWQMPIEGIWTNGTIVGDVGAGQHELKVWALDAGLVLEKIVMDLGGLQSSYLGPPESMRV